MISRENDYGVTVTEFKSAGQVLTKHGYAEAVLQISGFDRAGNFEMACRLLGFPGFAWKRKARRVKLIAEAWAIVRKVMGEDGSEQEADYVERNRPKPFRLIMNPRMAEFLYGTHDPTV